MAIRLLRGLLFCSLCALLAGCATAREPKRLVKDGQSLADKPSGGDGAQADVPLPVDLVPWRDADRSRPIDRARTFDKIAADQKPAPDASKPCSDSYEANESCPAAASAGSVQEATGWATLTATLDPANDQDWFAAKGVEKTHTCFPFTSQCFIFAVRMQVPTGRSFRVCVQRESCIASQSCADNQGQPGPKQLDVQYKVSGTCGYNDDTNAKISIKPLDGLGGCVPYTLSFRYDSC